LSVYLNKNSDLLFLSTFVILVMKFDWLIW